VDGNTRERIRKELKDKGYHAADCVGVTDALAILEREVDAAQKWRDKWMSVANTHARDAEFWQARANKAEAAPGADSDSVVTSWSSNLELKKGRPELPREQEPAPPDCGGKPSQSREPSISTTGWEVRQVMQCNMGSLPVGWEPFAVTPDKECCNLIWIRHRFEKGE